MATDIANLSDKIPLNLKVGYFPHSQTLTHPGDRRRFVFFSREAGIKFELADVRKKYDLVYLTSSCNVSEWIEYKRQNPETRLIFELIDSYLLERANMRIFLKGITRFLSGREKGFFPDYRKAFINIIKIADTVVCSTPIQKALIEKYNRNTFVSLDFFEDEIIRHKSHYNIGEKIKLVWEGQSYTLENILTIGKALRQIANQIELHVITDITIPYPFGLSVKSKRILDKMGINYIFHEWKRETFSLQLVQCDLALIPLNKRKNIMWQKPENKLLFFWQLGLPAITSPSPAYKRVMDAADVRMYAATTEEWVRQIIHYKNTNDAERSLIVKNMTNYVTVNHSKDIIMNQWKKIFQLC